MIVESVISWVVGLIAFFIRPIFETLYSNLHIDVTEARFFIPTPIFFIVQTYVQYAVFLTPIALGWWIWRQVKS